MPEDRSPGLNYEHPDTLPTGWADKGSAVLTSLAMSLEALADVIGMASARMS